MAKELLIYCDESIKRGPFYSNFYGGICVDSEHVNQIIDVLETQKLALNLHKEVKWTKVTVPYLDKYVQLIDVLFDLLESDVLKIRIMFSHNVNVPTGLSSYDRDHSYFLLYYQFIKHAFGLQYANPEMEPLYVRTYFDQLPDRKEKRELFQNHIYALQSLEHLSRAGIKIRRRDIVEVDSKNHVLLQCLDIVLGAMAFRLNDMHKAKPIGRHRRGKRTIAKGELYKHIQKRIQQIYPNFNIGISTGTKGDIANRWEHPYRHWKFIPKDFKTDDTFYK